MNKLCILYTLGNVLIWFYKNKILGGKQSADRHFKKATLDVHYGTIFCQQMVDTWLNC